MKPAAHADRYSLDEWMMTIETSTRLIEAEIQIGIGLDVEYGGTLGVGQYRIDYIHTTGDVKRTRRSKGAPRKSGRIQRNSREIAELNEVSVLAEPM